MACTMRLASENAKLGQPEVKLGIIPGYGGTQRLPRLVGKGLAMQMVLAGEMVTAQEAHRIGLVNEVAAPADLIPRAEAIAGGAQQVDRVLGREHPVVVGGERGGGAASGVVAHRRGHAGVNEAVLLRVPRLYREDALAQAGPDTDQGHAELRHVRRGREDLAYAGERRRLVELSLRHAGGG